MFLRKNGLLWLLKKNVFKQLKMPAACYIGMNFNVDTFPQSQFNSALEFGRSFGFVCLTIVFGRILVFSVIISFGRSLADMKHRSRTETNHANVEVTRAKEVTRNRRFEKSSATPFPILQAHKRDK